MTLFLLTLAIVAVLAATVRAVVRDDRGQLLPPSSHPVDERFLPPAAGGSRLA